MTRDQQIKLNAENGYFLVAAFDGYDIWKMKNSVGGWTYYCDKIGNEGAFVLWDTSLYGRIELKAILNDIEACNND